MQTTGGFLTSRSACHFVTSIAVFIRGGCLDIATVIGTVVCTRKEEKLRGYKLLLVSSADDPKSDPNPIVALDTVGAGVHERVIVVRGSSARAAANLETTPVDAAIVGIIDHVECDGTVVYRKGAEPASELTS